jgi:tryptophanase
VDPVVLPDDEREVERIVRVSIDRMVYAIAHQQFVEARFYSLVERRARARLDELRGR